MSDFEAVGCLPLTPSLWPLSKLWWVKTSVLCASYSLVICYFIFIWKVLIIIYVCRFVAGVWKIVIIMIIQCYFMLVFLHLRSCQTSASTSVNKLSGYSWRRTESESVLGTRFGFDRHHHPRDYHDLDGDDHDQPHRQFHDHLDHLVTNVDSQLGICLNSAFDSQMYTLPTPSIWSSWWW